MKALEMLYRDKKWIEEECDISKIPIERVQTMIKDLVEINEAIAELEALQSRSCDGCKYCIEDSNDTDVWLECRCPDSPMQYTSVITDIVGYLTTDFCCNRYEPKEK